MSTSRPAADLAHVCEAHARFLNGIEALDDAAVRAPSLLPDWTVGHVLTHVARNADSHCRRVDGALRGEIVDQYPGGYEGRAADIEAGASRPAAAILEDVRSTAEQLDRVWAETPDSVWARITRDVGGRERPLHRLPSRRWQELEVHLVDLDSGISYEQWPDTFVSEWLPRLRPTCAARLAEGTQAPPAGSLTPAEELAWLYGRLTRDDLPALAPWG